MTRATEAPPAAGVAQSLVRPRSSARKKTVRPSAEKVAACGSTSRSAARRVSVPEARSRRKRRACSERPRARRVRLKRRDLPSGLKRGLLSDWGLSAVRFFQAVSGFSIERRKRSRFSWSDRRRGGAGAEHEGFAVGGEVEVDGVGVGEAAVPLRREVDGALGDGVDEDQVFGLAVELPGVEEAHDAALADLGGDFAVFLFLELLFHRLEIGGVGGEDVGGDDETLAVGQPLGAGDREGELEDFLGFAAVGADDVKGGLLVAGALGGERDAGAVGAPDRGIIGGVGGGEGANGAGGGVEDAEVFLRGVLREVELLDGEDELRAVGGEIEGAGAFYRPEVLGGDGAARRGGGGVGGGQRGGEGEEDGKKRETGKTPR